MGSSLPLLAATLVLIGYATGAEQPPPSDQASASQPAQTPVSQLSAVAVEVVGDVKTAGVGASPLDAAAWTPVKLGQKLPGGTLIRTGLRSRVILRFGDDTVISVPRSWAGRPRQRSRPRRPC